jgi:hypothetical protein
MVPRIPEIDLIKDTFKGFYLKLPSPAPCRHEF